MRTKKDTRRGEILLYVREFKKLLALVYCNVLRTEYFVCFETTDFGCFSFSFPCCFFKYVWFGVRKLMSKNFVCVFKVQFLSCKSLLNDLAY